ncbi:hypothetical protein EK21DRAFT_109434 [Setomelanomma holmii]|uniref:Uncharacterized protein n=1 Tax=Setomelanomma holmii TaxID=210430 RepID=A0A9P4HG42_9PLEO|nr:hypothetical protein EK21DRAFT_109434 [Setomelanomma holmii]
MPFQDSDLQLRECVFPTFRLYTSITTNIRTAKTHLPSYVQPPHTSAPNRWSTAVPAPTQIELNSMRNDMNPATHPLPHPPSPQFGLREIGVQHGRGFHLIAKAIEEQSQRPLGLRVFPGRMTRIIAESAMRPNTKDFHPSVDDMEVYGFLESVNRPELREHTLGIVRGSDFKSSWMHDGAEVEDVSKMNIDDVADADAWIDDF